jgi:hypothetical protein
MTNMVNLPIHSVSLDLVKNLFVKFSSMYGQLWTSRHKTDEEWEESCNTWLMGLKEFSSKTLRESFREVVVKYVDYPPTLPQMIELCLATSGVPSLLQAIDLAAKQDFSHPIVSELYQKVGSWNFKTQPTKTLLKMSHDPYYTILKGFRQNQIAYENSVVELKQLTEEVLRETTQSS